MYKNTVGTDFTFIFKSNIHKKWKNAKVVRVYVNTSLIKLLRL